MTSYIASPYLLPAALTKLIKSTKSQYDQGKKKETVQEYDPIFCNLKVLHLDNHFP